MSLLIRFGLAVFLVHFSHAIKDSLFSRKPICGVDTRVENKCSVVASSARSMLECLTICSKKTTCSGASMADDSVCYLHGHCPEAADCHEESKDHRYFAKNCANGVWDSTEKTCTCVDGWTGSICNQLPKSCDDLITSGYKTGSHKTTLDLLDKGLPNIEVFCWIKSTDPKLSIVTLMKDGGKVRHDKEWSKFMTGYEMGAAHLWLGLHKWHVLSLAGYNTLTFKAYFYLSGACEYEWTYYNFTLSSQNENFAFSFDYAVNVTNGCVNTDSQLGDCLGPLQNVSFSTWDEDHDMDPSESCADVYGAGWWYSPGCEGPCHLLGWGQGYVDMVPPEHMIEMIGLNMTVMRQSLMSLEMHLKTPQSDTEP